MAVDTLKELAGLFPEQGSRVNRWLDKSVEEVPYIHDDPQAIASHPSHVTSPKDEVNDILEGKNKPLKACLRSLAVLGRAFEKDVSPQLEDRMRDSIVDGRVTLLNEEWFQQAFKVAGGEMRIPALRNHREFKGIRFEEWKASTMVGDLDVLSVGCYPRTGRYYVDYYSSNSVTTAKEGGITPLSALHRKWLLKDLSRIDTPKGDTMIKELYEHTYHRAGAIIILTKNVRE